MVVQRTINTLRERPKDERVAVAGGIAIAIVTILFFGWAIFFFRGINNQAAQNAANQIPVQYDSTTSTTEAEPAADAQYIDINQEGTSTSDQSGSPSASY